jgi:DNA mismatch endonuclease, patch repair protein
VTAYTIERERSDGGRRSWATDENARRAMRGNRRVDTKPEKALRSALHRNGLRFRRDLRLDLGDVHVRPDVTFTRRRVAVFVDGCFWHGCPEHCRLPRANHDYWSAKIAGNIERDRLVDAALVAAGWSVIRVWAHDDPQQHVARIARVVEARKRISGELAT